MTGWTIPDALRRLLWRQAYDYKVNNAPGTIIGRNLNEGCDWAAGLPSTGEAFHSGSADSCGGRSYLARTEDSLLLRASCSPAYPYGLRRSGRIFTSVLVNGEPVRLELGQHVKLIQFLESVFFVFELESAQRQ